MKVVYVDLLFLINFSMDFLCAFLVSKIQFRKLSLVRATLGAALGGAYSVASLFFKGSPLPEFILHILCCVLICLVIFSRKGDRLKDLIFNSFTYILASALLGGVMTATFSLLNGTNVDFFGTEGYDVPPLIIFIVGISSLITSCIGGRYLKRRNARRIVELTVSFFDREIKLQALCDSGNLLKDRISGRPVVVADESVATSLLGNRFKPDSHIFYNLDFEKVRHFVLIPYATASGEKTMVALRPQKFTLGLGSSVREVDALIGFAKINCGNDYNAIIPPELI